MGFCHDGLESKLSTTAVTITVQEDHPFIQLANALNWKDILSIVCDDIQNSTPALRWWVGRKLSLRIHLGVFILQSLVKMTDRGIEDAIRGNAVYQVFCGKPVIASWHCPDHTKIETFRNRISPLTQQKLVSYVAVKARELGFADPTTLDVDSTVQEAGMAYPSDACLLTKLAHKCKKVIDFIKPKARAGASSKGEIDITAVKKKSKEYFFMAKNIAKEIKHKAFKQLYDTVKKEIMPAVHQCMNLTASQIKAMPWNLRRTLEQIRNHAAQYLKDVAHFIKTSTIKKGKILSFFLLEVACITKGKVGKEKEFGRVFQLARIGGNFMLVLPSTSVRQDDKASLVPMVREHETIFGKGVLRSLATDKGYYRSENITDLAPSIKELGIQAPKNVKQQREIPQSLKNRRAGIEPLIGHVKRFGLGKSKAKSDRTTLASGYRAVMAFNLHQLTRYLSGKVKTMKKQ